MTVQYILWVDGWICFVSIFSSLFKKIWKFLVLTFIGERYYSSTARLSHFLCFNSIFYLRSWSNERCGCVFQDILKSIIIGVFIAWHSFILRSIRGITELHIPVAQYCVLIFAFLIPALSYHF